MEYCSATVSSRVYFGFPSGVVTWKGWWRKRAVAEMLPPFFGDTLEINGEIDDENPEFSQ